MGLFKFNKKEENMQRKNDETPLMNAPQIGMHMHIHPPPP